MDDPKIELVQSWLTKARNDLGSARRLASDPEPYLDIAIYHCQQAAEKALKGFLVYHDIEFEKNHNLTILVDLCKGIEPSFQLFDDAAATLTPYATGYRYPNEFFEPNPDEQEVKEAIQLAQQIFDFIRDHLPEAARPRIK
ncbi:HEPN domain-containing protein [bacterium]|nr:HEPN domain-containing protein [bacterium]